MVSVVLYNTEVLPDLNSALPRLCPAHSRNAQTGVGNTRFQVGLPTLDWEFLVMGGGAVESSAGDSTLHSTLPSNPVV